MSRLVVKHLESLDELRGMAPAWDDLWQRSEITLPTARAELVALWCECFAAGLPFRATLIESDGQLVAALPRIDRRWLGVNYGLLPGNHWSTAGDLLLDPQADGQRVCTALLEALQRHSPRLLWLDAVPGQTSRWQAFWRACEAGRLPLARRRRFKVNLVRIVPDWTEYLASRSRNHRRHVRRSLSRAERRGTIELGRHECLLPGRVEELLSQCFEIEATGWKGKARSSVLDSPVAWDFYLRQASQLAAWGQLSLTVLQCDERPIAFEYGWNAKGVYCSTKVGYDEDFADLSPGQLLRALLIEQFFGQSDVQWVDFLGPASDATSKWATHDYPVERAVLSLGGVLGRAVVGAFRRGGPLVRALRRAGAGLPVPPATDGDGPDPAPDVGELVTTN